MIPNLIDIILVMLRPSFIVRIDTANCINRTNKDYDIFRNYQKSVIKDKSSCEQHADGIQSYLILLKPSFIHLTSTRPSVGISEGLPVISLFMANLARFSAVFTTFLHKSAAKSTGGSTWHKKGYRGDFAKVFFQKIKGLLAKFFGFFQ